MIEDLWRVIGSVYGEEIFVDGLEERRMIEALWLHMLGEGEALTLYNEWLSDASSPMLARNNAPWGSHWCALTLTDSPEAYSCTILSTTVEPTQTWWVFVSGDFLLNVGDAVSLRSAKGQALLTVDEIISAPSGAFVRLSCGSSSVTEAMAEEITVSGAQSFAPRGDLTFGASERFESQGSVAPASSEREFGIDTPGIEWFVVRDRLAVSKRSSWTCRFTFQISDWSGGSNERHISAIWWDSASSGTQVKVKDKGGLVTITLERDSATLETVLSLDVTAHVALASASDAAPQIVELALDWDESSRTCGVEVVIGGKTHRSGRHGWNTLPVSCGFSALVTLGSIDVALLGIVSDAELFYSAEQEDRSGALGESAKWRYECEDPLIAAARISSSGFPLLPQARKLSHVGSQLTVEIGEEWFGWFPEFVRIESGDGFFEGALSSKLSDTSATYDLVPRGGVEAALPSAFTLAPWHLAVGEFSFVGAGVLETVWPVPVDSACFERAESTGELDAWRRWGRLVGAGRAEDSPALTARIRGLWAGQHSYPEPQKLGAAIELFAGLPFVRETQEMPQIEGQVAGLELESYLRFDSPIDADLLRLPGEIIGPGRQLLRRPIVVDWRIDEALAISTFGPLSYTGFFLVQLSKSLSISPSDLRDLLTLIRRSKKRNKGFRIQTLLDEHERFDDGGTEMSHPEICPAMSRPRPSSDMVFDALEPVFLTFNDALEPDVDSWDVDGPGVGMVQFGGAHTSTARSDEVSVQPGALYKINHPAQYDGYTRQTGSRAHRRISRALTPSEAEASGATRAPLRFDGLATWNQDGTKELALGTRPNELVRLSSFSGGSSALAQYAQLSSSSWTHPAIGTETMVSIDHSGVWVAADDGSNVWSSSDFGQSWSLAGIITTGEDILAGTRGAVGTEDGYIWVLTSGAWLDYLVTSGDAVALSRVHDTIVAAFDTGADTNVCMSSDAGLTWSVVSISGVRPLDIVALKSRTFLLGDDGRVYDANTARAVAIPGTLSGATALAGLGEGELLVVGGAGEAWRVDPATLFVTALSPGWTAGATLATACGPSWWFAAADDELWETTDAGANWSLFHTASAAIDMLSSSPRPSLAILDSSGGTAWT